RLTAQETGTAGPMTAARTHPAALRWSASRTIASTTQRTTTDTTTPIPASPYGIHTSACVHMTSAAASVAGHTYGMENSVGHTDSQRVRIHRPTSAVVP